MKKMILIFIASLTLIACSENENRDHSMLKVTKFLKLDGCILFLIEENKSEHILNLKNIKHIIQTAYYHEKDKNLVIDLAFDEKPMASILTLAESKSVISKYSECNTI